MAETINETISFSLSRFRSIREERKSMSGYVTVTRLSILQLMEEERKHQAHLKKISEMQRRSQIDNSSPPSYSHLRRHFNVQMNEKLRGVARENEAKSKKLIEIMSSKKGPPTLTSPSKSNPRVRNSSTDLSKSNAEYAERIANTKGTYDKREWKKEFDQHQQHLKIIKDNKLFTPRDVGTNRKRLKILPTIQSRWTSANSSAVNVHP